MLKARRSSTLKVYETKWGLFVKWCKRHNFKPLCLSSSQLADFFLYLFEEKNLAPITIKGYRSAIAHVYRLAGQKDPGKDMDLSLLMDNFSLEKPYVRRLYPKWSLDIVLKFLKSETFKDSSLTIRRIMQKAVFLVSLATAARVSEIHALSVEPDCLRFNIDGSVSLLTAPGFLAKNRLPEMGNQSFLLHPLIDEEELCPVKYLQLYLSKTGDRTEGPIFISPTNSKSSPQFISTVITGVIKEAYQAEASTAPGQSRLNKGNVDQSQSVNIHHVSSKASHQIDYDSASDLETASQTSLQDSLEEGSQDEQAVKDGSCSAHQISTQQVKDGSLCVSTSITAHELRAVAASLAFHRGAGLKDIIKAVGWSSASTFARFYLRHMVTGNGSSAKENVRLPA